MITIFNRKEVYNGFSMKDFNDVRDCLEINNIKYTDRCASAAHGGLFDTSSAKMGSLGENMQYAFSYYVYVHKDNYELACYKLNLERRMNHV